MKRKSNLYNGKKEIDPLREFQQFFMKDQKLVIISLFFLVAGADAPMNVEESKHIEKIIWMLGITLTEWFEGRSDNEAIYPKLKTLNPLQKEWLILTIQAVIDCDDKMNHNESKVFSESCEAIGTTEDEKERVIAKSKTIGNYIIYGYSKSHRPPIFP